jgi:hypothetical protein
VVGPGEDEGREGKLTAYDGRAASERGGADHWAEDDELAGELGHEPDHLIVKLG